MATRKKRTQEATPAAETGELRSSSAVGTAILFGSTFFGKAVQYAVVDGLAIVEGDIVLGTAAQMEEQRKAFQSAASEGLAHGVGITGAQFRWPNCEVPFEIDPALPQQQRVTDAIAHWEASTTYRFIARTAANAAQFPDFVRFVPGNGCSSMVGRRGQQQNVTLGANCTTGSCIHEIGHVIGLWHEQSREDRDQFVTINWQNITPGFEHNFNQHINDGDDIGPYDYASIMHYPRTAFSTNGQDTIVPVQANAVIGQRTGLSPGDIAAANTLCTPRNQTLKFRDDQVVSLKFREDQLTLKFRDDLPPPTLKFRDDPPPTLKFRDDPPVPTLKFVDDPPVPSLKFSDDPRPTIKFTDDPRPTLKFADDPRPTFKFTDDPRPTIKFADDPRPTIKFADDGGPGPIGPVNPPTTPFVLATPHHSMAWTTSFPEAYEAQVRELERQIEGSQRLLAEAEQAYQQGALAEQDVELLGQEYEQLQAMIAEYEQLMRQR